MSCIRAGDEQRCWNHKIVNVLNALPKKDQPEAAKRLSAMMYATEPLGLRAQTG